MASIRGHTYLATTDLAVTVDIPAGTQVGDALLLHVAGYFESDETGKPAGSSFNSFALVDFTTQWVFVAPYGAFDYADTFDPVKTFETFAIVKVASADDVGGSVSFTTSTNNGLYAVLVAVEGVNLNQYLHRAGAYWPTPQSPFSFTFGEINKGFAVATGFWMYDGATPVTPNISRGGTFLDEDDSVAAVLVTTESITRPYVEDAFSITYAGTGAADAIGWYLFPIFETASIDNFADAEAVVIGDTSPPGPFISGRRFNTGYSTETGEPHIGGSYYAQTKSGWWKYQPIESGAAKFAPHADYASVIDVFEGSALTGLTWLADNIDYPLTDGLAFKYSPLYAGAGVDVVAGHTYYIREAAYTATDLPATLMYQLYVEGPNTTTAGFVNVDAPAMVTDVAQVAYNPLPSPDDFADAKPVHIVADNDTFTSIGYDNTDYSTETGEPHAATSPFVERTAWWQYTPRHAGTVTFTTAGSVPAGDSTLWLELRAYTGTALSDLVQTAEDRSVDREDGIARITFYAYAGHTYYVQIGSGTDAATVVLTAQGPGTEGAATMAVDAAVMQIAATVLPSAPVRLAVTNPTPADGAVLPVARPSFALTVIRGESEPIDVSVTVNVGTAAHVIDVASLTRTVTLSYTSNTISFTTPADVPAGDYSWNATVSYNGLDLYTTAWTAFTVAPSQASSSTPVTWTVVAGTPTPHLWFVRPAAGKPGDQITAVGHGATAGTVTVNGAAATGVTFTQVAASGATTGRVIDPYTGVVDAEHFQAVFTVPAIAAPGGPVVITS